MSESVVCRGCGRRVRLPSAIDRSKARCPKCRTRVEQPAVEPVAKTPDAYRNFLAESQLLVTVQIPAAPSFEPFEAEVLSLDDAPAADPLPSKQAAAAIARPVPTGFFPPPFRFPLQVLSDSAKQFAGNVVGVLTPHGLFLESQPGRPFAFVPIGTPTRCEGSILTVSLAGRVVQFQVKGTAQPRQLAEDASAFLAGQRPVPLPAEYRRPWWLIGVFLAFVLGFAVVAAVILFSEPTTATPPSPQATSPVESPYVEPSAIPQPPSEPQGPPSHLDLVYRDGRTRLDDGPADVTAIAICPLDGSAFIGYADGTTRIWPLDQPAFEPPRLGPRGSGPIRRIGFDASGKVALLTCEAGLVLASLNPPSRTPILIPGEMVAVNLQEGRERFAAVRAGRVQLRYFPMSLVKAPPAARAVKGFLTLNSKDETLPIGATPMGILPAGGKPTFLAYHPSERLIAGAVDGSIASIPTAGAAAKVSTIREHKAAVRTWAVSPWGDFATGDDDGFVGYWPNKTATITKFKTGGLAIKGLAFNPCGGEIAVVDASGWVSVWLPATGVKVFEVKQKRPIAAVAYGPHDDVLLLADGKGVDVWWLPELAAQAAVP